MENIIFVHVATTCYQRITAFVCVSTGNDKKSLFFVCVATSECKIGPCVLPYMFTSGSGLRVPWGLRFSSPLQSSGPTSQPYSTGVISFGHCDQVHLL